MHDAGAIVRSHVLSCPGFVDRFRFMTEGPAPRVTVITPSLNQATFIERTIRSVLDQNYENLEYIVIDGGSNDGSQDIIDRFSDRIAYWVSEPDDGQSQAVNKGHRPRNRGVRHLHQQRRLPASGCDPSTLGRSEAQLFCGLERGRVPL